jgi:hypothetical protein
MNLDQFVTTYPRLWHMAALDSWPLIELHGLLSTSALLDLFEVNGERRFALESRHRPESVAIEHPLHGRALIRDQKPMNEKSLLRALDGMSPQEWYENLNGRVFFWLSQGRLERMLRAGAYRGRDHTVLEIATAQLLAQHADNLAFSPINSGATFSLGPAPRGPNTFRRFDEYPWDQRLATHPKELVVECAVDYHVPRVRTMVTEIRMMRIDA